MFVFLKLQCSLVFTGLFLILTTGKALDLKGGFLLLAKGRRLKKSLIKETQVDSAIHCIQQCLVEGPHCLSINHGTSSYAKGICQLNIRAAVGADEADLIVDKDFDYFERDTVRQQSCPPKPASSLKSALRFKGSNTQDYVITTGAPAMNAITVCFWIKTAQTVGTAHYVSYAVTGSDNEFLFYKQEDLTVCISSCSADYSSSSGSSVIKINDGKWHHICVTWKSQGGAYQIYKDGAIAGQGSIAGSVGKTIEAGGTWILGQDQDSVGGGFQASQAMEGEMVYCNIWSYVLPTTEILDMSKCCQGPSNGNVKSWDDFLLGIKGEVETIKPTCS